MTRDDLENYRAKVARAARASSINAGTLYNTPPPTQGLASLIILALFERLRVAKAESFEFVHGLVEATKRAFRVRDRVVTDPARDRRSRPTIPRAEIPRHRSRQDRSPQGREVAGAARRGRHHLDGRRRLLRPRRLLHPVALLGVRLRLRAAEDRRADAEPRRQLLARSEGAQRAGARAGCRSTRSIRRSRCSRTAASWPTAPWAATASRSRRRWCSRAMSLFGQPLEQALDAPRWLLGRTWGSTHTNLRMESRFDGNLIDRLMSAGHDVEVLARGLFRHHGPCRRGGAASGRHARRRATIRAPTAARRGSEPAHKRRVTSQRHHSAALHDMMCAQIHDRASPHFCHHVRRRRCDGGAGASACLGDNEERAGLWRRTARSPASATPGRSTTCSRRSPRRASRARPKASSPARNWRRSPRSMSGRSRSTTISPISPPTAKRSSSPIRSTANIGSTPRTRC